MLPCSMRTVTHILILLVIALAGTHATRMLQQPPGGLPADATAPDLPLGNAKALEATAGLLTGPQKDKLVVPGPKEDFVKDAFVVSVSDDTTPEELEVIMSIGEGKSATVTDISGPAFKGLAIKAPPGQLKQAELLQELVTQGKVTAVTADWISTLRDVQMTPPWGIDRIDDRETTDDTYEYTAQAGNVTVYVIDTGIRHSHHEFGGRASPGADFTGAGADGGDCNGHGTHVAGTIGGATYGVAKQVKLVSVRALSCSGSGTTTWLLSAINYVTEACKLTDSKKCVVNMSLGYRVVVSQVDTAIKNSINSGVVYVVAAGNSQTDSCRSTPGSVREAINIAATDSADTKPSWSNFGQCVDLFAPGVRITSTWYASDTATDILSGTSMAAPHATGVAALFLSTQSAAVPASAVEAALVAAASPNEVLTAGRKSPNLLLFTNY